MMARLLSWDLKNYLNKGQSFVTSVSPDIFVLTTEQEIINLEQKLSKSTDRQNR
jgi:hypothetical protein